MKFTWVGLTRLKPFDETDDRVSYADGTKLPSVLAYLVILAAFLAFAALTLAIAGHVKTTLSVGLLAIAASAVTAGVEWNAGMKARALNQLIPALVLLLLIVLLNFNKA
jgi:hypothetical protein